jgi:hypothetical protein
MASFVRLIVALSVCKSCSEFSRWTLTPLRRVSAIAKSSGAFFFIWTLLALGVTALFSVILSVRGLWEHLPWRTAAQHNKLHVA